ncbi:rhamnan synthesis F family protein [Marinobacterium lutimaris]|uniref:Glycosyl transferases group 1 n=1 Tax=Marinobacterium lutimaris TaxID=568106 RepID=A0A1H6B3Q6_9GAMM|nr:rhamnan synthesis F family protein [Marinobacterium lutimaris]SEG55025.1 Glycosyl transferases group 1 [Marinobacterium lutimaris]
MKKLIGKFVKRDNSWAHYKILEKSGVDWTVYAKTLPKNVDDPIEHFLQHYEKHPLVVAGWFDSGFYLEAYPDVRSNSNNPLVHFLRYGRHEGRTGCAEQLAITERVEPGIESGEEIEYPKPSGSVLGTELFDLMLENGVIGNDYDRKHVHQWIKDLLEVSEHGRAYIEGLFDQTLYETIYQDIASAPINSLHHFIRHGLREGRVGWLDVDTIFTEGGVEPDNLKSTLLVVSHDATATGAPAVALEVARRLSRKYNVITATLRGGALRSKFIEAGVAHLDAPGVNGIGALTYCLERLRERHDLSAVLLNSVESIDMADAAASLGLPTVSLLHEYAEYTRPVGKVARMLLTSDLVVYPAESLARSGLRELEKAGGVKHAPRHLRIQPQGYLGFQSHEEDDDWSLRSHLALSEDDLLVVGAGHIQPRKGVDWFLETCHSLQQALYKKGDKRAERLQFVWLGGGYDESDTSVSVWLDAYIHRAGIEDRVHFPGSVHDVGAALNDADLFLLTSRLDPFPNVAVDALNADCGIGAFRDASGIADFVEEHAARAVLGDYGDPRDLAYKVAEQFDYLVRRDGSNARICQRELDFDSYIDKLIEDLEESITRKTAIRRAVESEIFRERFDPDFYGLSFFGRESRAEHFLSLLYKGIAQAKPFPGSDIQSVLDEYQEKAIAFPELVEKAMTTTVDMMPVHLLSGTCESATFRGRIALQFHIYFADLIPRFCTYFQVLAEHDVDLFVTHVPELTEEQIELLKGSVSGTMHLRKVDNSGRDVYPFHRQFCEEIFGRYELMGHFHTKKSADNADGVGDRWRRYLAHNLLGSPSAAREILDKFNNERVGLIFAEDNHLPDEGKNGQYIEQLLEPLNQSRWPNYRHFPLGTMFWARVSAIEAITQWASHTFDLPEPIPYDGSILHAFERILPQLAMEAGYEVQRVYTAGTKW